MFGRATRDARETIRTRRRGRVPRALRGRRGGLLVCLAAALQIACTASLAMPRTAWARPILFEGGESGELADDGTITGSAQITLDEATIMGETSYEVRMPDGQVLQGACIDRDHWAPADGTYPFVAKPQGDGSYQVTVDSSHADAHPAHQRGEAAGIEFASPPQRIGQLVWRPTYRLKYPEYADIELRKRDAEGSDSDGWGPQGAATLAGARFELAYYDHDVASTEQLPSAPTRSWTLETVVDEDGSGVARLDDARCVVAGDELYRTQDGTPTIPEGCLTVREVQAPQGYELGDTLPRLVHVAQDGTVSWEPGTAGPIFTNDVLRAGVQVLKRDAERQDGSAQGDASLAGFTFVLVNRNDHAVVVNGLRCAPGARIESLPLVTDEQGCAKSSADALPLGSYELVEDEAGPGYLADAPARSVELTQAGELAGAGAEPLALQDHVMRGGVSVGKRDRETGLNQPLGDATLQGATFAVSNASSCSVIVDGQEYQPGEVVLELVSDEHGNAASDERALPYGSYVVHEIKAPQGYLPNETWEQRFSVRADGERVDLSTAELAAADQAMRSDLRFCKREEQSMELMGNVAFLVTSLSTGEAHVVVTDENGCYDSSAAWVPHSSATCANDAALREDGSVDDALLDPHAGLWFAGSRDGQAQANDGLGALPYDSYRVSELRCAANAGHALASWTVHVRRHGALLDLGTVDDHALYVQTELTDANGSHEPQAQDGLKLVDHVAYEGLTPGQSYQLAGELYAVGADDALELVAEGSASFAPQIPVGSQDVDFELAQAPAVGTRLVAFEKLLCDGQVVAEHQDASDERQSVWPQERADPKPQTEPEPEEPQPDTDPQPKTPQPETTARTPGTPVTPDKPQTTPGVPASPSKPTTPAAPAQAAEADGVTLPQTGVVPLGPVFIGGGVALCSGALIALRADACGQAWPLWHRRRSYGARERARALRRRCAR